FFFSSRRRHTRFSRDWSSDVCSSDLHEAGASAPSSSRTSFMAWRMSAAKKRLTCMVGIPRLVLAYGGDDGDLLVVRHFLVGQHMQAGDSQTCKAGEHGADRPGDQQYHWLAEGFLTLRGLHQGALQLFRHAGFEEETIFGALAGLLDAAKQYLFQTRIKGNHRQLRL